MIGKRLRAKANFGAFHGDRCRTQPAYRILAWTFGVDRVRLIIAPACRDRHLHVAIPLEICEGTFGAIDRKLVKVGTPQTRKLRIEIRKETPLQKRVFAEIDSRYDMAGAERDLLRLGEEVVRIPVESHPA